MSEIFIPKDTKYNIRNARSLASDAPHTTNYGINSVSHLAPNIWNLIPKDIKNSCNIATFKRQIKGWVPNPCPCNLCREYIHNIGYI